MAATSSTAVSNSLPFSDTSQPPSRTFASLAQLTHPTHTLTHSHSTESGFSSSGSSTSFRSNSTYAGSATSVDTAATSELIHGSTKRSGSSPEGGMLNKGGSGPGSDTASGISPSPSMSVLMNQHQNRLTLSASPDGTDRDSASDHGNPWGAGLGIAGPPPTVPMTGGRMGRRASDMGLVSSGGGPLIGSNEGRLGRRGSDMGLFEQNRDRNLASLGGGGRKSEWGGLEGRFPGLSGLSPAQSLSDLRNQQQQRASGPTNSGGGSQLGLGLGLWGSGEQQNQGQPHLSHSPVSSTHSSSPTQPLQLPPQIVNLISHNQKQFPGSSNSGSSPNSSNYSGHSPTSNQPGMGSGGRTGSNSTAPTSVFSGTRSGKVSPSLASGAGSNFLGLAPGGSGASRSTSSSVTSKADGDSDGHSQHSGRDEKEHDGSHPSPSSSPQSHMQQGQVVSGDGVKSEGGPNSKNTGTTANKDSSGPSRASSTLWMGDLEGWMDESYVRKCCHLMGWIPQPGAAPAQPSDGVIIKVIRGNSPASGYSFLTFPSPTHAQNVLRRFSQSPPTLMPGSTRTFKLNWATGLPGVPPKWEGEWSVFVGEIAREVGEAELVNLFTHLFPSTKSAKIMCDPSTGLSRGYGFVRFGDEADMKRALSFGQAAAATGTGLSLRGRTLRISEASGSSGKSLATREGGSSSAPTSNSSTSSTGGPPNVVQQAPVALDHPGPSSIGLGHPPVQNMNQTQHQHPSHQHQGQPQTVPSQQSASLSNPSFNSPGGSTVPSSNAFFSSAPTTLASVPAQSPPQSQANTSLPLHLLASLSQSAPGINPLANTSAGGMQSPSVSTPLLDAQQQNYIAAAAAALGQQGLASLGLNALGLAGLAAGPGQGLASQHPNDPNNTTVFVGGLPACISEETLKSFFQHFGEITYVKIPPNKGCGFVQFVRRQDAELAIAKMHDFPIHGKSRIRLSWGRSQTDKQVEHVKKLASALSVPVETVWRMVQGQDNSTIKQIAAAVGGGSFNQPGSSSGSSPSAGGSSPNPGGERHHNPARRMTEPIPQANVSGSLLGNKEELARLAASGLSLDDLARLEALQSGLDLDALSKPSGSDIFSPGSEARASSGSNFSPFAPGSTNSGSSLFQNQVDVSPPSGLGQLHHLKSLSALNTSSGAMSSGTNSPFSQAEFGANTTSNNPWGRQQGLGLGLSVGHSLHSRSMPSLAAAAATDARRSSVSNDGTLAPSFEDAFSRFGIGGGLPPFAEEPEASTSPGTSTFPSRSHTELKSRKSSLAPLGESSNDFSKFAGGSGNNNWSAFFSSGQ